VCIDSNDEVAFACQGCGEIGDVCGFIFATEEDGVFTDFSAACGRGDFFAEEVNAFYAVLDGERVFENVTETVTAEGDVFAFGIVQGDTEDFTRRGGFLENSSDLNALLAVN
jgi:hypothetical protein